jgi:hypothetical protein
MWLIGIVTLAGSLGALLANELLMKEIWDGSLMGFQYHAEENARKWHLVECEFVSIEPW